MAILKTVGRHRYSKAAKRMEVHGNGERALIVKARTDGEKDGARRGVHLAAGHVKDTAGFATKGEMVQGAAQIAGR